MNQYEEPYRLKSKDGLFCVESYPLDRPWICQDYIEKVKAASILTGASQMIKDLRVVLESRALIVGPSISQPYSPNAQARYEAAVANLESEWARNRLRYPAHNTHFDEELVTRKKALFEQYAPQKVQKWLGVKVLERVKWHEDPGKAAMASLREWEVIQAELVWMRNIQEKLPLAEKEMQKAGIKLLASEKPLSRKMGESLLKMIEADIEVFRAADAYLMKDSFALFTKPVEGQPGGFLNFQGYAVSDLAAARFFSSEKDATKFGTNHGGHYALVKVAMGVESFKVVGDVDVTELQEVVSVKEAMILEEALEKADVEQLKAALARLLKSPEQEEPRGVEVSKKKSRL